MLHNVTFHIFFFALMSLRIPILDSRRRIRFTFCWNIYLYYCDDIKVMNYENRKISHRIFLKKKNLPEHGSCETITQRDSESLEKFLKIEISCQHLYTQNDVVYRMKDILSRCEMDWIVLWIVRRFGTDVKHSGWSGEGKYLLGYEKWESNNLTSSLWIKKKEKNLQTFKKRVIDCDDARTENRSMDLMWFTQKKSVQRQPVMNRNQIWFFPKLRASENIFLYICYNLLIIKLTDKDVYD